jgi:hypothetical protein
MKRRLEQLLNLGAAVVSFAAAVGLDPAVAIPLLAAINLGLAVVAVIAR